MTKIIIALVALLIFAATIFVGTSSVARESVPKVTTSGEIAVGELPAQARDTLALIRKGGPFPYAKDGSIFGNRERNLAKQPRGHYKEYTVKTPGSRDRGARRIVCGGETKNVSQLNCFYTADHYATFKKIKE
jgi:ribonuclease T1